MKYLKEAVIRSRNFTSEQFYKPVENEAIQSPEDLIVAQAMSKVNAKLGLVSEKENETSAPSEMSDKGMFGGRQAKFKQNVWKIPSAPAGDQSQPVGLLTQSDLDNYVAFRKDDRLTFTYKDGSAGACCYEAKRGGSDTQASEYEWTDGLIQELIDEGALELM
jgi:hypothetical protein